MQKVIIPHQNILIKLHELQLELCKKINSTLKAGEFCQPCVPLFISVNDIDLDGVFEGIFLGELNSDGETFFIDVEITFKNKKQEQKLLLAAIKRKDGESKTKISLNQDDFSSLTTGLQKSIKVFRLCEMEFLEEGNSKKWTVKSEKWIKIR